MLPLFLTFYCLASLLASLALTFPLTLTSHSHGRRRPVNVHILQPSIRPTLVSAHDTHSAGLSLSWLASLAVGSRVDRISRKAVRCRWLPKKCVFAKAAVFDASIYYCLHLSTERDVCFRACSCFACYYCSVTSADPCLAAFLRLGHFTKGRFRPATCLSVLSGPASAASAATSARAAPTNQPRNPFSQNIITATAVPLDFSAEEAHSSPGWTAYLSRLRDCRPSIFGSGQE